MKKILMAAALAFALTACSSVNTAYFTLPNSQFELPEGQGNEVALQVILAEPLANTASLVMGTDVEKPAASIAVVDSGVEVFVVLEGKVDLSAEKARLEKEIAAAQKELAGCEKTLANEGFVAKAAPAVVQKKRDRAAELKEILAALTAQVADFS